MNTREKAIEKLIFICAAVSVAAVALITIFIFAQGMPAIQRVGLFRFVFGTTWSPTNGSYGILPLIAGSMAVTLGALVIGIPTGLGCAVFLSEVVTKRQAGFFRSAIELLAGIPSVVYGFFGLAIIVPLVRGLAGAVAPDAGATGLSVLSGAIILAIMILPTIVSISVNSIESVPNAYREASYALGADRRETVTKVILPAARSGIFSSIILGMGRAIGETMAVLLITGNVAVVPHSIFAPTATMTGTIAMEMSYAAPDHQQALFAIGIVLFVIIVILNGFAQVVMRRFGGAAA
ncbi:MAG: phosphate ABC transporter permease subunit PstC [Eubacteriaceae bacterium]|jgi:phosphate transport system permease protein|nr:phosphate ABC transporter permease subunit PstC [Eubacteriaceae bacterium]